MQKREAFFEYLNEKICGPRLRESECFEQAIECLKKKVAEKDYFRESCTDSDLTESCYQLFMRSGGISDGDRERLKQCLTQALESELTKDTKKGVLDATSCFAKELQAKIVQGWYVSMQDTELQAAVLRESIGVILGYENFYVPVAQQSYGYGADEEVAFSLSVNSTLTEWPGELPSYETMMGAFEISEKADVGQYIEQRVLEVLELLSVDISRGLSPVLDVDKIYTELTEYVVKCFDSTIEVLMQRILNSDFEYKNFYYLLLSDLHFEALGINQITAYYLEAALKSEAVENVLLQKKSAYETCVLENREWFKEWCRDESVL